MRRWLPGVVLLVVGVALVLGWWQGHRHEAAATTQALVAAASVPLTGKPVDFYRDIKPILDNRCLVCHGCYDAPCQLKLDSPEGLQRGATAAKVYDSSRLVQAPPTRLFVDAQSVAQWRNKGFFPVVNEAGKTLESNLANSVLYQMLALKQAHPLPQGNLPDSFDLSLDRSEMCPTSEHFESYAKARPLQGMPFGLPGLSETEFGAMKRWLAAGAVIQPPEPLSNEAQHLVDSWERFLNQDDLKTQLMSRYLFEHLFLADLYFPELEGRQFFKLVRSRTPPGQDLDPIASRHPFDDPATPRVYYRLQRVLGTVVAKTHMPYALGAKRQQRYRELFLDPDYRVTELPPYQLEVAANPFVAFAALPVQSRYRFLLDDAEFIISNFIKGPVCRGQVALDVIDDQFWVLFANPDNKAMVDGDFLAEQSQNLRLPGELENSLLAAAKWSKYSQLQAQYLQAKKQFLQEKFGKPDAVTLQLLWNGDRENTNAALTVFRHFDSASVVRGLVGAVPKTAWVIDYPLLERLHYLLVAEFDVYGTGSHQLVTRLYMDFLRMEGEYNFLAFLPKNRRDALRNSWYQGAGAHVRDSVYRNVPEYQHESGIVYHTKNPQKEFFDQVREYLGPALDHSFDLEAAGLPAPTLAALQKLANVHGRALEYLPETVFLRVIRLDARDQVFSLLHNVDHSNLAVLFFDKERRRPQFDTLSVAPGIIGAYPNVFWRVREDDLPQLVDEVAGLNSADSYRALQKHFAVARTGEKFWAQADWMHAMYSDAAPMEWGILDYSRYER